MNTSKGIFLLNFRLVDKAFWLGLQSVFVYPTTQAIGFIEQQIAHRLSGTNQ